MVPVIDKGSTVLTIEPSSPERISAGDIIFFKAEGYETHIVHRVVDINEDAEGLYFVTKGDNNKTEDPFKVRFSDIVGVVVGIIY